jgi:hypothetical protein
VPPSWRRFDAFALDVMLLDEGIDLPQEGVGHDAHE